MKCMVILFSCLMVSCAGPTLVRVEYAYGEPVHVANHINTTGGSGHPVDLHYGSIKLGKTVWENSEAASSEVPVGIDLFSGLFVAFPFDHESSSLMGFSVMPRVRYPMNSFMEYFVAPELGLVWTDGWEEQGGSFNFLVASQVGVLIDISDKTQISISTGLFHISNAGIKKTNPAYNTDLFMVGFEMKFGEDDE